MTVFVVNGASSNLSAHLTSAIGPGFARGLRANGVDVKVAWGGLPGVEQGIEHIQYHKPFETSPGDVMFMTSPVVFGHIWEHHPWTDIARKWLFTSCNYPGKSFAAFEVIFAENQHDVLGKLYPQTRVFDFLMGCEEQIQCRRESPFLNPKTVLFCGRLGEYAPRHNIRLDWLNELAQLLPDYHFIILSNAITLPYALAPEQLKGSVILPYVPAPGGPARPAWVISRQGAKGELYYVYMSSEEAVEIVNKAIGTQNLAFWGARNWGTFWEYFRHARCVLDFGFPSIAAGPNTKIVDPLRAGARIVAAGMSSTFQLVQDWGGTCVPYGDMKAMAAAIQAVPEESFEEKEARGAAFAAQHSWTAKLRRVLDQLGPDFLQRGRGR